MVEEKVVLVDKSGKDLMKADGSVRTAGKMEAHLHGWLHRAVSVFIFNSKGELLLQKRAAGKYHSAGKWSNTCCTHPRPGESPAETARRRTREEMGLEIPLKEAFTFVYRAEVGGDLVEYEFDHVFTGHTDGEPSPDASEVADWKWMPPEKLEKELSENPGEYTVWLKQCFPELLKYLAGHRPRAGKD